MSTRIVPCLVACLIALSFTMRWLFASDNLNYQQLTSEAFDEDFGGFLQLASGAFDANAADPTPGSFRNATAELCTPSSGAN